ncbi:MAG: O-antigen ligase family protein, partial [Bacteroidetes bacterium]|nr:O-antigen ligase family protein [Bacteroidota bacterium]
ISNITTDVSNTERINRWMSAIRMFKEKPLLGWGPGTFMFNYAPFQLDREKTAISTNFGTLGNAHSEYLGPLSESGFLGMLSFIVIVVLIIAYGMKIFYNSNNRQIKYLTLLILLSLTTYLSHGVMNNFLHTDKASVPFWALIAMLTVIDMHANKLTQANEKN